MLAICLGPLSSSVVVTVVDFRNPVRDMLDAIEFPMGLNLLVTGADSCNPVRDLLEAIDFPISLL